MSETTVKVKKSLTKRYRKEKRFRALGMGAVLLGLAFVVVLFLNIISTGAPAFIHSYVKLSVYLDEQVIDPEGTRDPEQLRRADYHGLVKQSLRGMFPDVTGRRDKRDLYRLVSSSAGYAIRDFVTNNPGVIGTNQELWFLTDDEVDNYLKGNETDIETLTIAGGASLSAVKGDITVSATDSTTFNVLLQQMQSLFTREQEELKRKLESDTKELASLNKELEGLKSLLQEATTYEQMPGIEDNKAKVQQGQNELADLEIEIKGLRAKIATYADVTDLSQESLVSIPANAPSYLLELNGGLVRIKAIGQSVIEGEVIRSFARPVDSVETMSALILKTPESDRRVKDRTIGWIRQIESQGGIDRRFNSVFFSHGDSREPEQAGIAGALLGTLLTLIVTLLLSFPIGVGAAIYLEEFAPKNKWTDMIEVNINNLAAVPSIVFGLLGLAVFINFFGLPRSAPVVGGMVLTLMTLPTIIIASRAALKSVPPSIKEAALGVGASRMQAMLHHVLPLALPGMLTGTIIGMAQALGETAPLLMIGMVAFIVDLPQGFTDNATVLPVQIYLWADSPERAFVEKTSAAIMVLLGFLISMNAMAVFMRKKFERKW